METLLASTQQISLVTEKVLNIGVFFLCLCRINGTSAHLMFKPFAFNIKKTRIQVTIFIRYLDVFLRRVMTDNIVFSPRRRAFVNKPGQAFRAEEYTDVKGL